MWLHGQPLAQIAADGSLTYYHNDHLGTPQKMTDSSGTVVWAADYLPFGQANVIVGTVENNLRFAGQYYDHETGLHYNYHRYYDPSLGRYLRADPIGLAGGVNLYAYVENNPVNDTDPYGLVSENVYLYQKVSQQGSHLKFGITKNPATRYTKSELNGGRLRILAKGPKEHMLHLERNLHKTLPIGPEEGQAAYYNIQKQKGLINNAGKLGRATGILGLIITIFDAHIIEKRAEERGVDPLTILLEDMGIYFYDPYMPRGFCPDA